MSSKPNIAEMNRDIALFMGYAERNDLTVDKTPIYQRPDGDKWSPCFSAGPNNEFPSLSFHESYDWLLPVWQKFSRLKFDGDNERIFLGHEIVISKTILYGPITEAHSLIWEGVKWIETIKNK